MTLDHEDGPPVLQSDEAPSGEHQVVRPRRREKKRSDVQPMLTSPRFESLSSTTSNRFQTNGFSHSPSFFAEDEDESMYR